MIFNTGAALLDAIVLSVVAKKEEGTYGYKITQDVRNGKNKLEMYRNEWISYTEKINSLLKGGDNNE